MIGQLQIEGADEFTYLDRIVTNGEDAECDVACWIGKATAVFQKIQTHLGRQGDLHQDQSAPL